MHRGFFLPVKALPPAPNGPGTGGGRCHATYLCGERFNSRPPWGGRPAAVHPALAATSFQSTPSARRATAAMNASIKAIELFQSTPSAMRATGALPSSAVLVIYFNPRPPRGGRRGERQLTRCPKNFNPRPPRGGRRAVKIHGCRDGIFQSTPSARRATPCVPPSALREEGDPQKSSA